MTTYQAEDRQYTGYSYPRPPGPVQGNVSSPERLQSAQGYAKGAPPQSPYQTPQHQGPPGSSQGYHPQPPITPLTGSTYPPQPSPSGGYYGLAQTPTTDQQHIPSPPPSSNGGAAATNFTPDGAPIVPVGISGGKMFRCRGYGDCDKVFTRSEHLARHVRKHTGERPFPCHCGKAFSRLDNLRQHAATVHADQSALNDAMLNSLAPVHAALSQRANREQRKRGEVVEVPKNAVERPRHSDTYRSQKGSPNAPSANNSPYAAYAHPEPNFGVPPPPRPRTGRGYENPYQPPQSMEGQPPNPNIPHGEDAGPSRRPTASTGYSNYPPVYYEQQGGPRPPTAPGSAASADSLSQLPYPYRPMSSNGRELPVPAHYSASEPSSAGHPPPPMYPPGPHVQAQWSSSPSQPHGHYPPGVQGQYPPSAEGYSYPPPPDHPQGYGPPPPPGSANGHYGYPPASGYYPSQHYGSVPPPQAGGPYPPPSGYAAPPQVGPPESPFQYHAPPGQDGQYPYGQFDSRKRRAEDPGDVSRKQASPSTEGVQQPTPQNINDALVQPRQQDALWLPPTSERRSSLAISALLGSPQQAPKSRPSTADVAGQPTSAVTQPTYGQAPPSSGGFTYGGQDGSTGSASMPATPAMNGTPSKVRDDIKIEPGSAGGGDHMEQKAKALLNHGA